MEETTETLGFQIYRTDEMADLISWMRSYNETAVEGQDIYSWEAWEISPLEDLIE